MDAEVSIVGLGKLGAPMAAAVASRGFSVVGADVSDRVVDAMNRGEAPVTEPGLGALLAEHRDRIRATTSVREAVAASSLTFIVVPTPSEISGAFSLRYVREAGREIGEALREKDERHLVVLTSTVLPGGTRHGLLAAIEAASGKRAGVDFGVCYSPEFIALGSVIHDFLHPDLVLIGEHDPDSGARLQAWYRQMLGDDVRVARMSLENAELAKVALNAYVTTKITFANLIADVCERLPGGDVDAVTGALGLDRRIGGAYLRGALGYGGPCFPRDNAALGFLAETLGATSTLPRVTDSANRGIVERVVARISGLAAPGAHVAVLGLAYKPDTDVVEESQGLQIAERLAADGYRVRAFDPLIPETRRGAIRADVALADDVDGCVRDAAAVVIATPDPVFRALTTRALGNAARPVVVIDCWRLLATQLATAEGVVYVAIGRGADDERASARLASLWESKP